SSLQSTYVFNSDPWGGGAMRLDFVSDNGYVNSGWSWIPLAQLERSEFNATSYGNSETFSALYDVVTRANKVITKTPEIESITQGTADRIVGEAQTLRATAYLMLAMTYGDVPLVEEPLTVAESEVGKSSKSEIMNFVIQDLKNAALKLPPEISSGEWGRLPRAAALGMAARAELYAGDYSSAAATAKEIIDSNRYSLYPDYDGLFSSENEINDEIIFPVTFARGQGGEG